MIKIEELKEKTISSEKIYEGAVLNLRRDKVVLPDKNNSYREVVEHNGGVTILALNQVGKILMVKQYRKAVDNVLLELPAGKLEKGEERAKCAKRELWEETGYRAGKITKIFNFYTSPGYSSEKLNLYLAEDLKYDPGDALDPGEFIENAVLEPSEIMTNIMNGKIIDAKTIIGLLYYLNEMADSNVT